jgi:hypothetical protein
MTSLNLFEGISKEHITNELVSFGVDGACITWLTNAIW